MSNDDILYGLEDAEQLDHDPEDIIEKLLDDCCEKAGESFDAIADRIEWPVKIYEYRRIKIGDNDAERIGRRALDNALDQLDEDYTDPEGNGTVATEKMKAAAITFGKAIIAEYVPWACERTGEVTEVTREEAKAMEGEE